MKLGPVTKLDKKKEKTLKKLAMRSYQEIVRPLSLFQFMANLEQPESRISEA